MNVPRHGRAPLTPLSSSAAAVPWLIAGVLGLGLGAVVMAAARDQDVTETGVLVLGALVALAGATCLLIGCAVQGALIALGEYDARRRRDEPPPVEWDR